jgi:RimJ/RimL family protein N-acetyltransferase
MEPVRVPDAPLVGRIATLRLWEPDDAEWYVAARDEEVFRWTTEPRALAPEPLRAVISELKRKPVWLGMAITDTGTGALLGNVAIKMIGDRVGEVSYWLSAPARRRGAATDAVRLISVWAFRGMSLNRIELRADGENVASRRVAARCGFVAAGERGGQLLFVLQAHASEGASDP